MSFTATSSINQAIYFITHPLSLIHTPATIHALQTILRSTFYAAFMASSERPLVLNFTASTPPRPVFAACVAVGIQWVEWIQLLGLREFDLIIDAHSVVLRYHATEFGLATQTVTLWAQPELTSNKRAVLARLAVNNVPQVPISKLGQRVAGVIPTSGPTKTNVAATPTSRIKIPSASLYVQPRTLAQQLIESDDEEANELFAMISKTSIISPTPTKERFNQRPPVYTISPISSPEPSSPNSSRPSSRSSSCFSDEGSMSSSLSSIDDAIFEDDVSDPKVYVDTSKVDKTKYLYQGGVSSTLTGGVMLGRPSAGKPKVVAAPPLTKPVVPRAPMQQKYRAPIGGRKWNDSKVSSWRRNTPALTPVRW